MDELIQYFQTAVMPTFPVAINKYMTIGEGFVPAQIEMAQGGNKMARFRLEQFREYLEARG